MKSIPSFVRGQGRLMASLAPQVVAAIDVGSAKTACLIAEWDPSKKSVELDTRNGLKILGFGQTASRGVKAGAVADITEAEQSIRIAVDTAERSARTTVRSAFVNVTGGKPATMLSSGSVKTQNGIVTLNDAEAAIADAVTSAAIGKRHVLQLLPVNYNLDGVDSKQAPVGMHGDVLSADLAIVTMDIAPLKNLRAAIERSHLAVAGLALSSYASAKSVLVPDEMNLGTVVLDLGGYTTNISVFRNGKMVGSAVLAIGGQHVTNDIAHGLSTTVVHAERLKTMFGSVLASGHDEREMLAVPLLGERGVDTVQKVPKHVLTSIIVPRMDEIFDHVRQLLTNGALAGHAANRLVITGGASQLHGAREFAAERLGLPARLGLPMGFNSLPDVAKSAGFANVCGLLVAACEPKPTIEMPQEARLAIDRSQMTYVHRLGKWLAEAI